VDQEGPTVTADPAAAAGLVVNGQGQRPVLQAVRVSKAYGRVVALREVDVELYPGEILALIGDNGAGKSTLIKCLSGAASPDSGEIYVEGKRVSFKEPLDARNAGIETVYQTLAVAPALDIASNLYLGREIRRKDILGKVFRLLDTPAMRRQAADEIKSLGIQTLQDITQAVETLSGGQRQAVAVARAAAFGTKVVILDEPTAALGVRETRQVVELIRRLRDHGLPIILIAHDIPMIFELADRIQIQRLARRIAVIKPETHSMEDAVAIMTGARAA
jgi:fructose transport system ATP-binding protein